MKAKEAGTERVTGRKCTSFIFPRLPSYSLIEPGITYTLSQTETRHLSTSNSSSLHLSSVEADLPVHSAGDHDPVEAQREQQAVCVWCVCVLVWMREPVCYFLILSWHFGKGRERKASPFPDPTHPTASPLFPPTRPHTHAPCPYTPHMHTRINKHEQTHFQLCTPTGTLSLNHTDMHPLAYVTHVIGSPTRRLKGSMTPRTTTTSSQPHTRTRCG